MITLSNIYDIIHTSIKHSYYSTHLSSLLSLSSADKDVIEESICMFTRMLVSQIDTKDKMQWFSQHLGTYERIITSIMSNHTMTEHEAFQLLYDEISAETLKTQEETVCFT